MCVPLVSRPNGLVSPLITDLPTKSKQVEAIITVIYVKYYTLAAVALVCRNDDNY